MEDEEETSSTCPVFEEAIFSSVESEGSVKELDLTVLLEQNEFQKAQVLMLQERVRSGI